MPWQRLATLFSALTHHHGAHDLLPRTVQVQRCHPLISNGLLRTTNELPSAHLVLLELLKPIRDTRKAIREHLDLVRLCHVPSANQETRHETLSTYHNDPSPQPLCEPAEQLHSDLAVLRDVRSPPAMHDALAVARLLLLRRRDLLIEQDDERPPRSERIVCEQLCICDRDGVEDVLDGLAARELLHLGDDGRRRQLAVEHGGRAE